MAAKSCCLAFISVLQPLMSRDTSSGRYFDREPDLNALFGLSRAYFKDISQSTTVAGSARGRTRARVLCRLINTPNSTRSTLLLDGQGRRGGVKNCPWAYNCAHALFRLASHHCCVAIVAKKSPCGVIGNDVSANETQKIRLNFRFQQRRKAGNAAICTKKRRIRPSRPSPSALLSQ